MPLVVLSSANGDFLNGAINLSLARDIEAHTRFLIAVPALIFAERFVRSRVDPLIPRFAARRIISVDDLPRFQADVKAAVRARDSIVVEAILLVAVYTLGIWFWRSQLATPGVTWYARPDSSGVHLTPAGYWQMLVSIPMCQFLLLRWYVRIGIWLRLLWQISRLPLCLSAAHPDRSGGIGFVSGSYFAFGAVLFAQSALCSGLIARRILFEGQTLLSFKTEIAGFLLLCTAFVFAPLLMFTTALSRARRTGLAEYGLLANRYVFGFRTRWIEGGEPDPSDLLGTSDIQSLADLSNSYAIVREMRVTPFGNGEVVRLGAMVAAPFAPLLLTMFSVDEILARIIKMVF
jgi:hypothetical protein